VRDAEQLAQADGAIQWATFLLGANPKPYWTQVVADIDYILAVLALADSGGDWQAARDQRDSVALREEPEAQPGA